MVIRHMHFDIDPDLDTEINLLVNHKPLVEGIVLVDKLAMLGCSLAIGIAEGSV